MFLMFPRPHETLDVGKSKMAEMSVPQKELLLCGGDVLIRLIEDGQPRNPVSIAGSAWYGFPHAGGTPVVVTGGFCKCSRKVGPRIDRTLEASGVVVSVHPEVAGISAELILGWSGQTIVLTEILRR